ncbi:MAG: zinc ribbon domain-containing protein [Promethearchaeota archaeon]
MNSKDRVVLRKGCGRGPDPSFSKRNRNDDSNQLRLIFRNSGRKVRSVDLEILESHFNQYVKTVNLVLDEVYKTPEHAEQVGKKLSENKGRAYNLLRAKKDLCYQYNREVRELVYERLHRNALEQAGRIILTDWTRRRLITSAIQHLRGSPEDVVSLLGKRRVPSYLIQKVRNSCGAVRKNGKGYHYSLGVLRQLRSALDTHILCALDIKIKWRGRQRAKISTLMKEDTSEQQRIISLASTIIQTWVMNGYPLAAPRLRSYSLDFSASTENTPSQGYWFSVDKERENEILLHIKLPPGIDGEANERSPYKSKTLTFRFLNWLPRASIGDSKTADTAEDRGDASRAERLRFRAAKFQDMHQQLMNTIEFQHKAYELMKMRNRKSSCPKEAIELEERVNQLRGARRSAPPLLLLRGHMVLLRIPFLSPNGKVSSKVLGERKYDTLAGVDRGIRVPLVLSVKQNDSFNDIMVSFRPLLEKREKLRKHAYRLTSELARKKNNWDKKRSGLPYPASILKGDRHVTALWKKYRRLDREIAHQIASRTVWFCETHRVEKLFFEDLRSFQTRPGLKDMSWFLGANLWGKIIEAVRYMRESLGHSKYSVWTVNPRYTSQTCHQCGERGMRVGSETSTSERKGGEFFYCSKCDEHFHADINAARNIIHVHKSSAVPGRTA